MARVLIPLAADTWTDLGTGRKVITIEVSGTSGKLHISTAQSESTSEKFVPGSKGVQIISDEPTDRVWAKAVESAEWALIVDTAPEA